jgi:hypothetical protein
MEGEKVRCPICRSKDCTRKQIAPSDHEFICSECTAFRIHEDILNDHLHSLLKTRERDKVSAAIREHFENDSKCLKIVLWHSKTPTSGVEEKTISELEKEGEAIFADFAARPKATRRLRWRESE